MLSTSPIELLRKWIKQKSRDRGRGACVPIPEFQASMPKFWIPKFLCAFHWLLWPCLLEHCATTCSEIWCWPWLQNHSYHMHFQWDKFQVCLYPINTDDEVNKALGHLYFVSNALKLAKTLYQIASRLQSAACNCLNNEKKWVLLLFRWTTTISLLHFSLCSSSPLKS